jgi:hypothetical protein
METKTATKKTPAKKSTPAKTQQNQMQNSNKGNLKLQQKQPLKLRQRKTRQKN